MKHEESSIFINPLTDFGFKFLFGQEENKDFLLSFLNALKISATEITDVRFIDKELLSENKDGRALIYDLHCITSDGKNIIVEMQNRYQTYFNDRALYYLSKDIANQGKKGSGWKYKLTPVHGIFMMNFKWKGSPDEQLRTDVGLMDIRTKELFSDKLMMTFLKIPLMDKSPEECKNTLERWIYLLKNMEHMEALPTTFLKDPTFRRLEKIAKVGALPKCERRAYEESLKRYRDWNAVVEGGHEQGRMIGHAEGLVEGRAEGHAEGLAEGLAEGRAEGRVEGRAEGISEGQTKEKFETVRRLFGLGLDINSISIGSGMTPKEVERILRECKSIPSFE